MERFSWQTGSSQPGWRNASPSVEDRRSVLVSLTAAGEQLIERLARIHLEGMLANETLLVESLTRLRHLAQSEG